MANIRKGNIVLVKAKAVSGYMNEQNIPDCRSMDSLIHEPRPESPIGGKKCLVRAEFYKPLYGVVIGKTYRATGLYKGMPKRYLLSFETSDDDPPYLEEDKRHWGWLVEPLDGTVLYREPIFVLEKDLELARLDLP